MRNLTLDINLSGVFCFWYFAEGGGGGRLKIIILIYKYNFDIRDKILSQVSILYLYILRTSGFSGLNLENFRGNF